MIRKVDGVELYFVCDGYIRNSNQDGHCGLERRIKLSDLDIKANERISCVRLPVCQRCGGTTSIVPTVERDLPKDHVRRVLFRRVFELSRFADKDSETHATATEKVLREFYEQNVEGRAVYLSMTDTAEVK